ncbi:MAG TPA: class I SAM-dependent methyltransferase [Streptosporangiaceae bacterium]|nr:class I SAM-dependent methyltransferase [Streptosporangiaceae bacterium]
MAESGPGARQDRGRGGARLAPAAYDRWFDTRWGRYASTIELAAIERAAGRLDGLRVLDAGCGTGRFTAALERRAARLAGVDLDPAMLTVAGRRVRAPLLGADAGELPFRDEAFDVTIAVTVCEFAASPAALVAELARVTRPGGRVVIGALNRRSPWGLARRRQLRRPPWQAARFLTRRQLRALGAPHGQVKLHGTLILPGTFPGSRHAGRFLEAIGRRACPATGAFQVLTVERAP